VAEVRNNPFGWLAGHPFNGLLSRTTWVSWHQRLNQSGF